jgi:hypothetical protein
MVSSLGLRGREGATAQEGHVCGHVMVNAPWQVCFACVCGEGGCLLRIHALHQTWAQPTHKGLDGNSSWWMETLMTPGLGVGVGTGGARSTRNLWSQFQSIIPMCSWVVQHVSIVAI